MRTTIAAGPPWVEAARGPTAAAIANDQALRAPIFGSTPSERALLQDLRDAAAYARAERALRFARAN